MRRPHRARLGRPLALGLTLVALMALGSGAWPGPWPAGAHAAGGG